MKDAWSGEPVTLDDNEENAVIVYPQPFKAVASIMGSRLWAKALAQAGKLAYLIYAHRWKAEATEREL